MWSDGISKIFLTLGMGFFAILSIYFQKQILNLKDRIRILEGEE